MTHEEQIAALRGAARVLAALQGAERGRTSDALQSEIDDSIALCNALAEQLAEGKRLHVP